MKRRLPLFALLLAAACLWAAGPRERALELRNRGFAQLENEQPAEAEATFTELVKLVPDDPMPRANLAIAQLRQQQFNAAREAIAAALELTPGRPELVAIQGEVEQWSGRPEQALALMRRAAEAAPDNPRLQHALYRQAAVLESEPDLDAALERLARLRPENLVVMLQLGKRAIAGGDRADASAAFLRVRELIWQAPVAAQELLAQILAGLEAGDVAGVRVAAMRLENVLKITPMFRGSQLELDVGIQGDPIFRFRDEPGGGSFGDPLPVRFAGERLSAAPGTGALASGDFDGDSRTDLARVVAGPPARLEVRAGPGEPHRLPAPGIDGLLAADLDNDGRLDLIGWGPERVEVWRGAGDGTFTAAATGFGLGGAGAAAAAVLDHDIEGDLDLALAPSAGGVELWRNSLEGPLEPVGAQSLPQVSWSDIRDLLTSDLDRDGDLDLLVAHAGGLAWLDNLRQGRFALRDGGFEGGGASSGPRAVVAADLDNDGLPEVVAAGSGLTIWGNRGGRFEPWRAAKLAAASAELTDVLAFDADNNGRLDLALTGPETLAVLRQRTIGGFDELPLVDGPAGGAVLAAADLDGDGDLDLLVDGVAGLHRLDNRGGNENHWLSVRLRGLDKGSSKNNALGYGSWLEVRAGDAYQFREASGDVVHFGLGGLPRADLLRVVWTNGVPQNRLEPESDQWIVEEQLLKGSCPFLYAWDGERFRFVTDLLWGAPAGLPLAPGVWAPSDPHELVLVEGAAPEDGVYRLRVTEELWEAAFFDITRLWVVDHPADIEVASSLKIVPGQVVPKAVMASRELRPVAAAIDAAGRDVTSRITHRDEIYADGWRPSRYQGVAAEPWAFTFDLGAAPGGPLRLHLDGWIFPADASLNLAVAQRSDLPPVMTRLEVETGQGWRVLMDPMGFPAGKTKTMVVDTPPLPDGAQRLRIVSNQWLSWDRIAWTLRPADGEPLVRARLEPRTAELRFRGFSRRVRQAPNAPHGFDYAVTRTGSPWLPFPGHYTRFGQVGELLAEIDDELVILGPGDEIALEFDARAVGEVPAGWRRAVFLESFGWDKDADRNTWEAQQMEPLPFGAMSGYPYGPGESYPDSPRLAEYRNRWLTRVVEPPAPGHAGE